MKTLFEKMRKNREAADKRALHKAAINRIAVSWREEEKAYEERWHIRYAAAEQERWAKKPSVFRRLLTEW